MFKTILVPLDGSDIARGILPYVSQIARKTGTPLVLHTAIDLHSTRISETSAMYLDQIEVRLRASALGTLKEIADQLREESIGVRTEVTVGSPAEEILRFAGEAGCDLIAMSTHGRNAIGRSILGSVTDKIVHSADVPVLTISPETARKYQEQEGMTLNRVILPMDGSELAEQAVPYAVSLAQAMSLEVELVQVVPTRLPAYAYPGLDMNLPDFSDDLVREATENLDSVAKSLENEGLTVRTHVLRGSAASALVEFAQQTPQGIITMTSRGRSGLTRWMLGSVAEALVRASGDPVLIIPSRTSAQ